MKRIIITFPQPLSTPGGGTVGLLQIAQHLDAIGVPVILVPVGSASSKEVPLEVVPARPSRLHYLFDGIHVALTVRGLLERYPVRAVISWGHEAAFLPGILRRAGVILAMIAAFPSYRRWAGRATSWQLVKRISDQWFRWRPLHQAQVVFALSEFTRQELISLLGLPSKRVVVAHWGVDPAFFAVPRTGPEAQVYRLIFYGALAPHKGIFELLEALGHLPQRCWLKLAGWGMEEQVMSKARALGIVDRMLFLGRLNHSELLGELAWAQLAVLPSHMESFGLSIAEASAAGLPVVSCYAGAIPEVVEDGVTGILVPPGDVRALVEAIAKVMSDPRRAFHMGLAGRERIRRLYSWERTVETILKALAQLEAHKCKR